MSDTDFDDTDGGWGVYPIGAYDATRSDRQAPALLVGRASDAPEDVAPGATAFRASSGREDRHTSVIDQSSWRLGNFRKNPVILLNHGGRFPVGRATLAKIVGHGTPDAYLRIDVLPDRETPDGAIVGGMLDRQMLNAGSVGFRPGKQTDRNKLPEGHPAFRAPKEGDSPWWPALYYERAELLEFSVVTVPSNVDAQALRAWGAASTEDPDERIRRVATEIVDARGLDLVMRALRSGGVEIRALLTDLVFGSRQAPRKADPLDYLFAPKEG